MAWRDPYGHGWDMPYYTDDEVDDEEVDDENAGAKERRDPYGWEWTYDTEDETEDEGVKDGEVIDQEAAAEEAAAEEAAADVGAEDPVENLNWQLLAMDITQEIFSMLPRNDKASMISVCKDWSVAGFSLPPWPVVLKPMVLGYRDPVVPFTLSLQVIDPKRHGHPPLTIGCGMRLIGGGGVDSPFLFVDYFRKCLVLWTVTNARGSAGLFQREILVSLPNLISLDDLYIGCVAVNKDRTGHRILIAGGIWLFSVNVGEYGEVRKSWSALFAMHPGSSSSKEPPSLHQFVTMFIDGNVAYLLDDSRRLSTVTFGRDNVMVNQEWPVRGLSNPLLQGTRHPRAANVTTWFVKLPSNGSRENDIITCICFESHKKRAQFRAYDLHLGSAHVSWVPRHTLGQSTLCLSWGLGVQPVVLHRAVLTGYPPDRIFDPRPRWGDTEFKLDRIIDIRFEEYMRAPTLELMLWPHFEFWAMPAIVEPCQPGQQMLRRITYTVAGEKAPGIVFSPIPKPADDVTSDDD